MLCEDLGQMNEGYVFEMDLCWYSSTLAEWLNAQRRELCSIKQGNI